MAHALLNMSDFRSILLICLLAAGHALAASGTVRVEIKDPKGAPVADAVASLVPLQGSAIVKPPIEPVVVTQNDQDFQPFVTVIAVGTRVSFPNQDKVAHHVYSQSKAKPFEIPRYRGEPKDTILFDQPGIVALGCNIHDWMLAYIVVLATPHFAKSSASGMAQIGELPAGTYRLEVWHPRLAATVNREVTIAANPETQVISVTLRPDKRIRRAPESGAGAYK